MKNSKYTFDSLVEYVGDIYKRYLNTVEAGTEKEREKEHQRKEILRNCAKDCFAGAIKDKDFVKQFIFRVLEGQIEVVTERYGEKGIQVNRNTYYNVYNWDNPARLPTQVKFLGIIYFLKYQYGENTIDYLLNKYNLTRLRPLPTTRDDGEPNMGAYIDSKDIDAIFIGENVTFSYELAIDVLTQMIYEEFKGNGCIDEILYQNIDDIGIGLSGLQDEVIPSHLKGKKVKKAYDGAWIKHKGILIHLMFLSFGSFTNLRRVVNQIVSYEQHGSFSEQDGYKLGYGKDGSRRTAVITPFSENCAAWIRKFTAKNMTNRQLISADGRLEIGNIESLIDVERALVKGGATIPICGPQGAGKTTKLEAIAEYIQNWYAIRMIESEFEARLRWRYPEKNILTVQTTTISPEEAYEFSLRTSGDIYIVAEARSDDMMVNITRTANRGGRSVIFTYHPNKPRSTIIEIANSLVRKKLYNSLKDAMYTALNVVKCCIHIEIDLEKRCRYYNIYEYRPLETILSDKFLHCDNEELQKEFMRTQFNFFTKMVGEEYFEVVPIITYNYDTNSYEFQNTISDRFFNELMSASNLGEEKNELLRIFRPKEYIDRNIKSMQDMSIEELDKAIKEHRLCRKFVIGE